MAGPTPLAATSDLFAAVTPRAACADPEFDPDWWFARRDSDGYMQALGICRGCETRMECLDAALEVESSLALDQLFGVFGGLEVEERRRILRYRRRVDAPEHGTERRYQQGCRCGECLAAHAGGQRAKYRSARRRKTVAAVPTVRLPGKLRLR